jgi:branched-chain amino acid transport system substrate-binding protein
MTSRYSARSWARRTLLACLGAALSIGAATLKARAADPVKIGFSVSLTGGLASSGKAHLLSKQIWAEEVNAKGGLLGQARPSSR